MRRIDRWVGVPLCFLLTLWRRIFEPPASSTRAPEHPSTRPILFIQTAEMGSLVLAVPAVRLAREMYPGAAVHFLVFSNLAPSVVAIGLTTPDRVFTIDPSSLVTISRDTWRFMRRARRERIHTAVNLEMFARFGSILTFLSGAARRAGFHAYDHPGLYCGDLLTHRVIYNPHVHTAEALVTIVRSLEEPIDHVPMGKLPSSRAILSAGRVATSPQARQQVLDRLAREQPAVAGRRLIVINPNASQRIPIRRWPLESYADLAARLVTDPDNACVLIGGAAEQADTRFIADRIRSNRIVDLAGKTTIRELLDLYSVADLLVTNDSGPAQLAALTDVDILVFFGPETPALYKPIADPERCHVLYSNYACSPCVTAFNQRRTPCTDNVCLKSIGVAGVHEAALAILERRRNARAAANA